MKKRFQKMSGRDLFMITTGIAPGGKKNNSVPVIELAIILIAMSVLMYTWMQV